MRSNRGGIAHMAAVIAEDLEDRETGLHKPHITGLADLSASALACRSVNSSEWMAVLPRADCAPKSRERYISRFLSNARIDPLAVMAGFVPEILAAAGANGKTAVFMLDQSRVSDGVECLMVSLRVGERAIPVAWRVVATAGAIGFDVQKPLLDTVTSMVPEGITILLAADRFYGTAALIGWCQAHGWQYRIRLKGDLILHHQGGEMTTGDAAKAGLTALHDARLGAHRTTTHLGILHEQGHKEPWIIAMSERPSKGRVLDYSMRWGIEALFSDMKSRGFGITETRLKHAGRIERLILVLAIATYWAVSTGMTPPGTWPRYSQKKRSAA